MEVPPLCSVSTMSPSSSGSGNLPFSGGVSPALERFPPNVGQSPTGIGAGVSKKWVSFVADTPELPQKWTKSGSEKLTGQGSHVYHRHWTPPNSPPVPTGKRMERSSDLKAVTEKLGATKILRGVFSQMRENQFKSRRDWREAEIEKIRLRLQEDDLKRKFRPLQREYIQKLEKDLGETSLKLHREDEVIRKKRVEYIRAQLQRELQRDPDWFDKQIERTAGDMKERKNFLELFGCRRMDTLEQLVKEAKTGKSKL